MPLAAGIVLGRAPGNGGGSLNPKRSAISTRRLAPTLTPSGAKTELHDSTNEFSREPPHDSPLAFDSGTPSMSRSEEHTSELQSQFHLVCRLLLEKKKK